MDAATSSTCTPMSLYSPPSSSSSVVQQRHARLARWRLSRHRVGVVVICASLFTVSTSLALAADPQSTRKTGQTATKTDGSSSSSTTADFVSTYYALYKQETSSPSAASSSSSSTAAALAPVAFKQNVPVEIKERLDLYSLEFADLPELMKRALLWESGYSLGDTGSLAQIHTLCGMSMAEIALSADEFKASTCETESCSKSASAGSAGDWSYSQACKPDQLLSVAKCSSTAVDTVSSAALWSSKTLRQQPQNFSASTTVVPNIQVRKHKWPDPDVPQPAHVYAIHTTPAAEETDVCELSIASASFVVVPCVPYQRTDKRWCRPTPSDVMTNWLEEFTQKLQLDHQVGIMPVNLSPSANASLLPGLDGDNATAYVKDVHGVYVSAAYKFDGSSSDFSQQFYRRYLAASSADTGGGNKTASSKLNLPGPLPKEIEQRLSDASLQFDDLPALLQRALVWDSGYALDASGSSLAAVFVKCGLTMSDLAISKEAMALVSTSSCAAQNCTSASSNAKRSYRSMTCSDDQFKRTSQCAVTVDSTVNEENDSSSSNSTASSSSRLFPMWADGGDDSATPELRVRKHEWENDNSDFVMYSISSSGESSSQSGKCPDKPSMIIPCVAYSSTTPGAADGSAASFPKVEVEWCRPKPGSLVTSWLRQVAKEKEFSLLYLIPILISVALGVTGLAIYIRRKTFKRFNVKTDGHGHRGGGNGGGCSRGNTIASTPDGTFTYGQLSLSQTNSCVMVDARLSTLSSSSSIESFAAFSSNNVLNTLVNHPSLRLNTVPFDQIQFVNLLSAKGVRSEIWLGSVRGEHVAVKRLSRAKKAEYDELEEFMGEITLNASLDHPNLAKFIGVAWTTLQNLCMLSEYVENGDLQLYLKQRCLQLAWEKAKMHIAMGIASAICCLHQQQPRVVHRDLRSKSVLLTLELDAKLIHTGVGQAHTSQLAQSQSGGDAASTPRPYWTAPEVLQGHVATEKSDMYAFGVILSELDTHQPPFEGLKCMATGADLSQPQILQQVVAGKLKPATSPFCPLEIAELIDACLASDPQRRPSASDALVVLAKVPIANVGVKTYSF